ncbi:MAG: hypothetical protein, partial [Olavius algarvensis Gamma 1 endosymbiont]
ARDRRCRILAAYRDRQRQPSGYAATDATLLHRYPLCRASWANSTVSHLPLPAREARSARRV